jgi:unsaturated chondroitin disaccharide hydrolase
VLWHCLTTQKDSRGDGSTAHEGIFDLESGEFWRSTQQGYRGDSCWSRGLAWAIYGFTGLRSDRDPRYRAGLLAHYILNPG